MKTFRTFAFACVLGSAAALVTPAPSGFQRRRSQGRRLPSESFVSSSATTLTTLRARNGSCDGGSTVAGLLPTNAHANLPKTLGRAPPLPRKQEQQHRHRTLLQASTTVSVDETAPDDDATKPSLPAVLWRFTRPHTIIGSALAIPALHVLAAPTYAHVWTASTAVSVAVAMMPSLLMNLYVTGLNQLYDVDIDKINKPDLPLVCGDLSMRGGIIAVASSLILSLAMGLAHGSQGLNLTLWFSALLGTLYSVPPFRLKRFPFLAAFCIVAVRGAVINAGFFAHAKATAYGASAMSVLRCLTMDPRCVLSSLYFAVFGVVIALMKDVPDAQGDRIFGVRTFSVRLGQKRVFSMMHRLLSTLFVGVGVGFWKGVAEAPSPVIRMCRSVVGIASLAAAMSVQKEAAAVDAEDSKQVYGFYMHLWKLFYLSYLVLPFAR